MTIFRRKYDSLWLVATAGFLITAFVALRTYHFELGRDKDALNREAIEQVNVLKEYISDSFGILDAITAFYDSSVFVDRNEFRVFTKSFLSKYSYIQALEWVPKVVHAQRIDLEETARKEGLLDFRFIQLDKHGQLIKAPEREIYYPVYYLEPFQHNKTEAGFDLSSDDAIHKIMEESAGTGEMLMTSGNNLIQEKDKQYSLLAFKPVYDAKNISGSLQERLKGFAVADIRINNLIETAFKNKKFHDVEFIIYDVTDPVREQFLYTTGSATNIKKPVLSGVYRKEMLNVGGRTWEILACPKGNVRIFQYWEALLILLMGLGITFILGIYLFMREKREEKIEQQVEKRTKELSETNEKLKGEVICRQRTEELLKRKALESQLIYQATTVVAQAVSFEDSLQYSLDVVCQLTSWPLGHVYLPVKNGDQKLVSADIWHCDNRRDYANFIDVTMKTSFRLGEGLPGRILQSVKPAWITNVLEDNNFPRAKLCKEIGVKGAFGFPIIVFDEVAAVLEFFNKNEMEPDEGLLHILKSLGDQVGRILERKQAEMKLKQEKERLQLFQNVTVNRELEMIELKKENNELHRRLGDVPPHDLTFLEKGP